MNILVLNAGSSSLKYELMNMETEVVLARGLCERVGSAESFHTYCSSMHEQRDEVPLSNHYDAVKHVIDTLTHPGVGCLSAVSDIVAIGHRVVHGGDYFTESVVITSEVLACIEDCCKLAPLHNPAALAGINACQELIKDTLQVAVFDTAFHQSMPPKAYMYPLPYELYEQQKIRRFGFHGTSHRYIAQRCAAMLGRPQIELKIITCHLGNGCSLAAVDKGRSVDTTMGFTPLEGLMMGTRCGSIDPAIVIYLIEELGYTPQEAGALMNKQSGLLGISGLSNDLRDVRAAAESGNARAQLAYELYSNTVKKHIGAFTFALGGVDAIVLTGGVGENCDKMRRMIFEGLEPLGIVLDQELNVQRGAERSISTEDSRVKLLVIPTNEELMIAKDVRALALAQ